MRKLPILFLFLFVTSCGPPKYKVSQGVILSDDDSKSVISIPLGKDEWTVVEGEIKSGISITIDCEDQPCDTTLGMTRFQTRYCHTENKEDANKHYSIEYKTVSFPLGLGMYPGVCYVPNVTDIWVKLKPEAYKPYGRATVTARGLTDEELIKLRDENTWSNWDSFITVFVGFVVLISLIVVGTGFAKTRGFKKRNDPLGIRK